MNDAATRDEQLMRRAIGLAMRGRGGVEPNPMVGCVLVKDGEIVGEGFHAKVGGDHAEPTALAMAGERARGATAYVTLEPCCHSGGEKRTPPCAPRLIEAGVKDVVIGCLDPNPRVDGGGVDMLHDAGVQVKAGVLGSACRQLIAPFVARIEHRRPYVTLKWAVSRDGKVAGKAGRPVRITNAASDRVVQNLRGRCDAVAVGTNTVRNDDPQLTARGETVMRTPLRVVFSNSLDFGGKRRLIDDETPTLIYTVEGERHDVTGPGVDVVGLPATDNGLGGRRFSMLDAYRDLARRGVGHLLVEPGPKLAKDLMSHDLADRVWVFGGQGDIGDDGLKAPACPWFVSGTRELEGDVLRELLNPSSPVFFAPEASADLMLVGNAT